MLACEVRAKLQPMQTNCLFGLCHSNAHSNEMRPSQRQLSLSWPKKSAADVSCNTVIMPPVRREGKIPQDVGHLEHLLWWSGPKQWSAVRLWMCVKEDHSLRCKFCCVCCFDVLWCGDLKGECRSVLTFIFKCEPHQTLESCLKFLLRVFYSNCCCLTCTVMNLAVLHSCAYRRLILCAHLMS